MVSGSGVSRVAGVSPPRTSSGIGVCGHEQDASPAGPGVFPTPDRPVAPIPFLYVAYFFHDRAMRPRGLAPRLATEGLRPILLCASNSEGTGPPPVPPAGFAGVLVAVPEPLRNTLRSLGRTVRSLGSTFRRGLGATRDREPVAGLGQQDAPTQDVVEELLAVPDRHALWIPGAVVAGLRAVRRHRCRVIFASGGPPSVLVVGWLVARLTRLPLVCEFRDLWVDNPFVAYRFGSRRRLDRSLERRILRRARHVVTVTEPMAEQLRETHPGLSPGRIHVIPNGFDPGLLERSAGYDRPRDDAAKAGVGDKGRSRPACLTYTGELYGRRSPYRLLEALTRLRREHGGTPPVILRLVGRIDERFRAAVARASEDGIAEASGTCTAERSFAEMMEADFLLLLIEQGAGARGVMTSKIFPYLAIGRPILATVPPDGVAGALVRELRAGLVADPDDVEAIVSALRRLLAGDVPLSTLEERAERLRSFSWPALAARLGHLLREAAGESGPTARAGEP